jgi:hypothetical protein
MADTTTYGGIAVQGLTLEKLLRVISDGEWVPTAANISGTLTVDTINEYTGAAGVTIDGVLVKDSFIGAQYISAGTFGTGSYIITGNNAADVQLAITGGGSNYSGSLLLCESGWAFANAYGSYLDYDGGANALGVGSLNGAGRIETFNIARTTGAITFSNANAPDFGSTGLKADVIAESTAAAGVTIDGLLIKDGGIPGGVAGGANDISTTVGATTVDWDDGQVQTIVIGGSHTITVGGASSNNKAGGQYFLYVDANGQNPSWTGVDWGTAGEPTWDDNHLVMFVSPDASSTVLGVDLSGGHSVTIPA